MAVASMAELSSEEVVVAESAGSKVSQDKHSNIASTTKTVIVRIVLFLFFKRNFLHSFVIYARNRLIYELASLQSPG